MSEVDLVGFSPTPAQVAAHSFLPLLGYEKKTRKIDFSVFPPLVESKGRKIKYAAHKDSAIYSFYSRELSRVYETYLVSNRLDRCVLAYRSGIGYNVPFAKSLFDEIRRHAGCTVVCLDLSKFFDRLAHDKLKTSLQTVLNVDRLAPDWHRIFERHTRFEYVDVDELEASIGKNPRRRICSIDTFRRAVRPLVRKNPENIGIPQGTPLSGLLANVYMIGFDAVVQQHLGQLGGSYRRYSDDIALLVPADVDVSELLEFMARQAVLAGAKLNEQKTCVSRFTRDDAGLLRCEGDLLQYLGFTFNGKSILIRAESMKAFYARMKTNIRRYVRSAAKNGLPLAQLRKRVLVGRFTHWGDSRNFVQYAYRAASEFGAPEVKRQLRKHVDIFDRYWIAMLRKYGPNQVAPSEAGEDTDG